MKWEVKDEKNCRKVIDVEVEKERVEAVYNKIFASFKDNARIEGFRKGKAPESMIKTKFSKDIEDEVMKEIVPETYNEVMKELDLKIVTYPMLQEVKRDGDGVKYKILVEVNPVFDLKDYKKIRIEDKKLKEITEADVNRELDRVRQYRGKLKDSTADKVKEGHYVTISMAGFLDGKAEPSMTSESQFIKVGAGTMIKDLEDGLVGLKPGEEKDINVKFPADYREKRFAGAKAVFKVNVKSIKELELPELTDEFAKEISGKETAVELKNLIKENLMKQAIDEVKNFKVDQVIGKLIEMHNFELPQGLVEEEINNIVNRYQGNLNQQGLNLKAVGMTIEDLRAKSVKQAEANLRMIYILRKIAEAEKIEVTDPDVEVEIRKIAEETNDNAENMIKQAKARGSWDALKAKLLEDKVVEHLVSGALK
ncbi:MAG: trigger factor [Candidatus Goldiibacteriota bacterium]|jgi:trigger factor